MNSMNITTEFEKTAYINFHDVKYFIQEITSQIDEGVSYSIEYGTNKIDKSFKKYTLMLKKGKKKVKYDFDEYNLECSDSFINMPDKEKYKHCVVNFFEMYYALYPVFSETECLYSFFNMLKEKYYANMELYKQYMYPIIEKLDGNQKMIDIVNFYFKEKYILNNVCDYLDEYLDIFEVHDNNTKQKIKTTKYS